MTAPDVIGWYDDTGRHGEWHCTLCGAGGRGRRAAWNRHYLTCHHDTQEPVA